MNFADAVVNQTTRTENGMQAYKSTTNNNVDFFFKAGAMRGQDIIPQFVAAFTENKDLALRNLLWLRDIRGGAGERQLFRNILMMLEYHDIYSCKLVVRKTAELGRWDDLLVFTNAEMQTFAFSLIKDALERQDQLCAKWMPRQGVVAVKLRKFLNMSPKQYRKTLVNLTNVVESKMCANKWDEINFSHVPSVASKRYVKAFYRHTEKYDEYVKSLINNDPSVKVNASAIFPHDIIKDVLKTYTHDETVLKMAEMQWKALPNYMTDGNILPIVDVSGSMADRDLDKSGLTAMDVAISLGLYMADKNKGTFKDLVLTFSDKPEIERLSGNIIEKIMQLKRMDWDYNTNLHAALDLVLETGIKNNVLDVDMPKMLLILSDMQFDDCVEFNDSAINMIHRKYIKANYSIPRIVFWNLAARDNVPVKFNENDVALVSGYSTAILKSLLDGSENFTPESIMLKTIMKDRYRVN